MPLSVDDFGFGECVAMEVYKHTETPVYHVLQDHAGVYVCCVHVYVCYVCVFVASVYAWR